MAGPTGGGAPPALSRYGTYAAIVQNDSPAIAALKQHLLLAAIDKSPRLRTDLDLIVITQFFATLDSLKHVSSHALHYLATECTSMTLRDGDVFCYQEDSVVIDSNALVIIEGSLCGYFNKAFSQRSDTTELFTSWNARQNRKRGVLVDFGDFQTTYAAGALCGFDDLLVGIPNVASGSSELLWYRRKGIHAQEQTRAISFKKDTLDRAAQRYGLTIERGILHTQREAASTDVSHVAVFSAFSEASKQALLHHAPRRHLLRGGTLFASPRDPSSATINALAIVLSGRLDIYWTGPDDTYSDQAESGSRVPTPDQPSTPKPSAGSTSTPLFSIRRGQTIGDQTLGLALHQLYDPSSLSSPASSSLPCHTLHRLPIRIVSGEDTTEVLLVPLALYAEKRTEDHAVHEYTAQLEHQRQLARQPADTTSATTPSLFAAWAPAFFAAKTPVARTMDDLHDLLWRLRVDGAVAKAFFQFPPLVLERVCHAIELVHFDALVPSLMFEEGSQGDAIDEVYVVAQGALRGSSSVDSAPQDVYLPGDIFGLVPRAVATDGCATTLGAVYADPDTMLLAVPRACVERWLQPVKDGLVVDAGSLFQRHAAYIAAHPPRLAMSYEKRKSLTAMARRASAQDSSKEEGNGNTNTPGVALATAHVDALATLLQRMGVLTFVPHAVLRELLAQCSIVHKQAGEIVCHEHENATTLVAVLSGFLRVFSLEHMGAAIDMFRQHTFCQFASLHHLFTKQDTHRHEDGDHGSGASHGGTAAAPSVLTRHRSAMYGVHLQTLHAHNAFRTGVLREGTQSPATVVAQTPSVLLIVDEASYSQVLRKHAPGVDLAPYYLLASVAPPQATEQEPVVPLTTVSLANGERAHPARLVPQPLLRFVEASPLAWLARLSSAKRQLVLRHARLLVLQPGDRVLRHGDVVDHVFVVVSGALALNVRPHHDRVATALDASQRSVRSLMLERNVTSNYSTTSHQLSSLDASSPRGADPRLLQHKRAMLQQKVSRMVAATAGATPATSTEPREAASPRSPQAPTAAATAKPSTRTTTGLFMQSVVAAVREDKRKKSIVGGFGAPIPGVAQDDMSPRKSVTALTLHAAVSRATLAHRLDQRRSGGEREDSVSPLSTRSTRTHQGVSATARDDDDDEEEDAGGRHPTRGSVLLCHLRVGDVYGEEAIATSDAVVRSAHDVFAETTSSSSGSVGTAAGATLTASASALPSAQAPIELLCIHRAALLAVLRKSDEEAEQEIRGRAKAAKNKWQLGAEQIVATQKKNSLVGANGKKMPKLFDLFKNILNQRYYITMRAITDIPLLQDLSDTVKREICAGARFEAVERFANVYKDDARGGTTAATGDAVPAGATHLRYYFVLSGRVGLFPKSAVHGGGGGPGAMMALSGGGVGSGSGSSAAGGKHGSVSMAASLTAASNHYAGLSGSMDACLQEVTAGRGFGELELLVPEASRHHMLAVALEPTKLLSLPGELFLRHWPQVSEMERNIAYLRGGRVRFFARLEMEKIASLYHALRNESYDRGARILEQNQPVPKSEVIFLKDGECAMKNAITLQSLATADHDGNHDEPVGAADVPSRQAAATRGRDRAVRVLATIADVRGGHVFWLDAPGRVPFALHAISSRVDVARVGVDKLRAVLPKSHLAQLEECCDALAALYRDQLTRARRTIVRVMNDKRDAELRRVTTENGSGDPARAFLPALHYTMQASNKKAQLQSLVGGAAHSPRGALDAGPSSWSRTKKPTHDSEPRSLPLSPAIPYARVLASKPIDLVRVQAEERAELQRRRREIAEEQVELGASSDPKSHSNNSAETELDAAYRVAHQREHYQLVEPTASASSAPTVTLLRGSFPDDPSLRRRRRLLRQTSDGTNGSAPQLEAMTHSAGSKVNETSTPETLGFGRGRSSDGTHATKPNRPIKPKKNSFTVDYYGDQAEWNALFNSDGDAEADFVVDLRAHLQAELQSPLSPLRSIKLEPSGSKLHSMGKYIDLLTPSPATASPRDQQDDHPTLPLDKSRVVVPTISIPRVLPSGWSAKPPIRTTRPATQVSPGHETSPVARRQGFLLVLDVPENALVVGFAQDQFLRTVVHRQRRRLVVLEDATLREFAEDTTTHETAPTSRALRVIQLTSGCHVRDAPTVSTGESDVVLRHSFVLESSGNHGLALLLTCESLVDKTNWMLAIRTAAAMGTPPPLTTAAVHVENGAPGSPKFKHRHSVAMSVANRETRRLSMVSATLGGRNAVVQEETVLEVEYRIS